VTALPGGIIGGFASGAFGGTDSVAPLGICGAIGTLPAAPFDRVSEFVKYVRIAPVACW
jgi:hypothetical protein